MFFELTRRKMLVLASIAVILAVAVAGFLVLDRRFSAVDRVSYHTVRAWSGMKYRFFYKPLAELEMRSTVAFAEQLDENGGNARSIPVLLYHGEGGTVGNISTLTFVKHMLALKKNGWHTITMEQFDAYMKGAPLPEKSFLLTFDDGRRDTFYPSDPVLEDLGFHGVMFVVTGFSLPDDGKESNFYLGKTELTYMEDSGRWDIESHGKEDHRTYEVQTTTDLSETASTTQGHYLSNIFWNEDADRFETAAEFSERVRNDLALSKKTLEDLFGRRVTSFAYPFNDYGDGTVNFPAAQKILDTVVPSLYAYAFYQTWNGNGDTFNYPLTNNGPGTGPYMIKRIEPLPQWSSAELLKNMEVGVAKDIPYKSTEFGADWAGTWGEVVQGGPLSVGASPATTGGSAFLLGSNWWREYAFSATIDWQSGSHVSLIARNFNDNDFLSCTFSTTRAIVEEHHDGNVSKLAEAPYTFSGNKRAAVFTVAVEGNTVRCYADGLLVVSGGIADPRLSTGGIGVENWDKTPGLARMVVKNISVTRSFSGRSAAPAVETPGFLEQLVQTAQQYFFPQPATTTASSSTQADPPSPDASSFLQRFLFPQPPQPPPPAPSTISSSSAPTASSTSAHNQKATTTPRRDRHRRGRD